MSELSPINVSSYGGTGRDCFEAADESRSLVRQYWTAGEEKRFREAWLRGELAEALRACPGRSAKALCNKARRLKLPRTPKPNHRITLRYTWSEEVDRLILRRVREANGMPGVWRNLALELNRSRTVVRARAAALGIDLVRIRPADWTPEEDAILVASHGMGVSGMQKKLRAAGFSRSENAVRVRARRIGASVIRDLPPNHLPLNEVADLLGVEKGALRRAIDTGELAAKLHGKDGYLVKLRDLRQFIIEHPGRVHLGKVEAVGSRFWFIDLLSRKAA